MDTKSAGDDLRKALRRLVWFTVVLYLALVALGIFGYIQRVHDLARVEKVTQQTNTALCLFRANLKGQVETSTQFLVDHPNGIPGLSAEVIQSGIDRQTATLKALEILEC
jgi:hypothetical protein